MKSMKISLKIQAWTLSEKNYDTKARQRREGRPRFHSSANFHIFYFSKKFYFYIFQFTLYMRGFLKILIIKNSWRRLLRMGNYKGR